ncbi:MAG: pentapeptide repeat-containing protein [Acidimicrobiales bacterium]
MTGLRRSNGGSWRRRGLRIAMFIGAMLVLVGCHQDAETYVVNTGLDFPDPDLSDGLCGNANFCSLRAAVMQANVQPGVQEIVVPGRANVTRTSPGPDTELDNDIDILEPVVIRGGGEIVATSGWAFEISNDEGLVELDDVEVRGGVNAEPAMVLTGEAGVLLSRVDTTEVIIDSGSVMLLGSEVRLGVANQGADLHIVNSHVRNSRSSRAAIETTAGTTSISFSTIFDSDVGISGPATVISSIVSNNDVGCVGPVVSLGYNIDSGSSCGFDSTGDQSDTDPLLLFPINTTFPVHPLVGSPAIDTRPAGVCSSLGIDIRGEPRPANGACDTGAIEAQNEPCFDPQPGDNLAFCDLRAADLSGRDLTNVDLTYARLDGADLRDADLTGARFDHSVLTGADLDGTELTTAFGDFFFVASGGVIGAPASLPPDYSLTMGYLVGPTADLTDASLPGADLAGRDLRWLTLDGIDLAGANLTNAMLSSPLAPEAFGAVFDGADFTGAHVSLVVSDSSFVSVNVSGATIELDPNLRSGGGNDFSNVDFTTATFDGSVNLRDAVLIETDFTGRSANVVAPGSDWTDADLTNAQISGSFDDALLDGTIVSGLDLSSADLDGVRSGGLVGLPVAIPSEWTLWNGHLIGAYAQPLPGADLAGLSVPDGDLFGVELISADLSGADLSGATLVFADLTDSNLADVDLDGTNLNFATFDGVSSGGLIGQPTISNSDFVVRGGYLIGPKTNLRDAQLSGLDLSSAVLRFSDLAGAQMIGTNLTGAFLRGADLTGADLTGADLTDVGWKNTTCPDGTNSDDNGDTCEGHL